MTTRQVLAKEGSLLGVEDFLILTGGQKYKYQAELRIKW